MKRLAVIAVASIFASLSISTAFASEQECKKLKNESDVIYAAKGFCFKDPEAKAKFNDNCFTTKPKFTPKEQEKLDAIKERQKELNCK
jgi:type II secretory pathway component PulC